MPEIDKELKEMIEKTKNTMGKTLLEMLEIELFQEIEEYVYANINFRSIINLFLYENELVEKMQIFREKNKDLTNDQLLDRILKFKTH